MIQNFSATQIDKLIKSLVDQSPFSELSHEDLSDWVKKGKFVTFKPGERILRPDEITDAIFLIISGDVRLLTTGSENEGQFTIGIRGPGQLLGWINLLRGHPTEFVQSSTETTLLALSVTRFLTLYRKYSQFSQFFDSQFNCHEAYQVYKIYAEKQFVKVKGWQDNILDKSMSSKVVNAKEALEFLTNKDETSPHVVLLSTPKLSTYEAGQSLKIKDFPELNRNGFTLPFRFLIAPAFQLQPQELEDFQSESINSSEWSSGHADLQALGIVEEDKLDDESAFPFVRGKGLLDETLAISEMMARFNKVPFRKDSLKKIIKAKVDRDSKITLEMFGGICEYMSLNSQIAETNPEYVSSIEFPVITVYEGQSCVIWGFKKGNVLIADPTRGGLKINLRSFVQSFGESKLRFVTAARTSSSPYTKFGWSWFTPLLKKYKTSIGLVFIASLLSQLFSLAIPLLIQQIIDKVLSQGNASSLNILGGVMIVLALFSGALRVLRTYIFVDTTDRMDLTLGSSVIGKLLSLPMSFFEKRPVGELSQRLGELNTIRGFLTGTALISVLNIIFAILYLVVMFIYSPYLSVIALSTFPLYLILVLVVAPIYKSLIRRRAVAQARTQSHLIEVLGGIQTVKAQNFELTARWKWQDRYKYYISEGFKSTALGATAGEIGAFLNQVSSLLVLWIGMTLILKGEFTLGQLIAFRIISGNVTGPLLQLASLYQGFQSVQLSMERLSDVLDQTPEFKPTSESSQIPLPGIKGKVRFEDVDFRFAKLGPFQVNNVSFEVDPGNFVGIVGQSGSGKSTLMKLLPKLYEPENGRIFIDDYDISKVDLQSLRSQVGIVPQDSLLFEGTVAENIALNDPDASSESIIEAAKIACAHDFIMQLGQGYATPLAERGSNLSGGQRQRIAIARTILNNPNMLVLDEATSALDFETEKELCTNLQDWSKGKTVFFITHRLSTIRSSDLILVMDQGSLIEIGNHASLLGLNGMYSALSKQQEYVSPA